MKIDAGTLKAMVDAELAVVQDHRVTSHIRRLLVEPRSILRRWDYGVPGQQYPCWIVLDDSPHSETAIAYCESGFGPRLPWGLISTGDDAAQTQLSMGMDSAWFSSFMEAFLDSFAATALPIWRVFEEQPDRTMIAVTDEGEWDDTWRRRDELQAVSRSLRYHCQYGVRVERSS